MEKLNILAAALIILLTIPGCRNSIQHSGLETQNTETETTTSVADQSALIDTIDQYVNTIRENGDQFDFKRTKIENGYAVVCTLNGDVVKVSILDSIGCNTDYYIRSSRPVFMNRNVFFDVDSSYMESAYYIDGNVYKYFCDGFEITNKAAVDQISLLTRNDLAAKL